MPPNISVRDSIRWLPDPPSEPTSTLVLTSAENRFVDTRVLLTPDPKFDDSKHEDAVLPITRLDWAFAGTSTSTTENTSPSPQNNAPPQDKNNNVDRNAPRQQPPDVKVHSTWHHWVDSHHPDPSSLRDEGDMFALEDGRTLERGRMINPATGKETGYEEIWRDVEATELVREGSGAGKVCMVLMLDEKRAEDGLLAKGMVVRIGQFVQGVLRVGDESFCLERWEMREGKWKRLVRMGDLWLPCGVAMDVEKVVLGGEVGLKEMKWRVVELSYF